MSISDNFRAIFTLTRWDGGQAIIKLALPLILSNFAYVALTTTDIIMLGRLTTVDIASAGLAFVLFGQLKTSGVGLVTGVSNLVAEARANNDKQKIKNLLVSGFFWSTIAGLFFCICLLCLSKPLLILGQDPAVVSKTIRFLFIMAPGMLPCLWFQTLRHFTTGLKCPGPMLAITVFSVVFTIVFDYVLIYGKFGFPHLGYLGAAVTAGIVFLFSFFLFLFVIRNNRVIAKHLDGTKIQWSSSAVKEVWRLGIPISATYASEAGFFTVLTIIIGSLGKDALAAQTIINQIVYIALMVSAGISHATSVQISEAYGVKDYHKSRDFGILGMKIGIIAMFIIGVMYFIVPAEIAALFISDKDGISFHIVIFGLFVAAFMQIFDAAQNIGTGILRGIGDTINPFRISLIGYWLIGLPVIYLLGFTLRYNVNGIWIGQTIGLATTAFILFSTFLHRIKHLEKEKITIPFE